MLDQDACVEQLNLYQKLARIRDIADAVVKNRKGYNYTYADLNEILAKVKSGMKKYAVSLVPRIVPGTSEVTQLATINTKFDKTGKPYDQTVTEILYKADAIFTWVNDDNPQERIEVPWTVTGSQTDPSQAFGSGMTYCTRYFLSDYFQVALVDDVDAYRSKQKEAAVSEDRALAEEIIAQFDTLIKQYLAYHPDKAEDARKFVERYVKKADYKVIKESALAAKLLTDFKDKFMQGE